MGEFVGDDVGDEVRLVKPTTFMNRSGQAVWGAMRKWRAAPADTVVIYDDVGIWDEIPGTWPETVEYRYVRGGYAAWASDVRTAAEPTGHTLAERERIERQNQISAYFTGAAVQTTTTSAPPPVMPMGGGAKKKKAGGC